MELIEYHANQSKRHFEFIEKVKETLQKKRQEYLLINEAEVKSKQTMLTLVMSLEHLLLILEKQAPEVIEFHNFTESN